MSNDGKLPDIVELEPCPFCGGEAGTLLETRTGEWKVWCLRPTQKCGCMMIGDTRGEVERKWNCRAEIERLRSPVPAEDAIRCAQQLKHELQDLDFLDDLTPNEQNALVVARAFLRSPAPSEDMEARKDAAYLERNQVVAALASVFPSGTARTAIPGWSDDWHGCVYIDLPTGQASWHYHDSHAHLFARLPPYAGQWDGHTTDEKYARLAALPSAPAEAGEKLWLWRDGKDRFLAFRSLFPTMPDGGDPATIGQPSGYAFYHPMTLAEAQKVSREADRAALSSGRDGRKT